MNMIDTVAVFAWEKKIAILKEIDGKVYFQYEIDNTLNFSPVMVDTDSARAQEFSFLSFQKGLPGFIHDSLPGQYGNTFLTRFFQDHYGRKPNPLEELLFLGNHALGALSYRPSLSENMENIERVYKVRDLYEESRKVINNEEADFNLAMLIAITNSATGGAKSKVSVGYNPETKKVFVSHKHADLPDGYHRAIIKFDEDERKKYSFLEVDPSEISVDSKLEYVYWECARASGIDMPMAWLIEDANGFHFAVERFDHIDDEKFHMHSFAGLHHNDASSQSISYELLFRTCIPLNTPQSSYEQIFRVMMFNLIFGNRDDHSKNFSFLMDKNGEWRFAPAYDLTFATHQGSAPWHQMTIGGKAKAIDKKVITDIAQKFRITDYRDIVNELLNIRLTFLSDTMNSHGINKSFYDEIITATEEQCNKLKGI